MSTPWIPNITRIADGQAVSAATVNPVLAQLAQRDQFLYDSLASVNSKSSLVLLDQPILDTNVHTGSLVCMVQDNGGNYGLQLAQTAFDFSDIRRTYAPAASSYVLGIVYDVPVSGSASVLTSGLLELADVSVLLEDDETAAVGPYYLSPRQAGRITANPGGLAIYVGYMLPPTNSVFTQFYVTININELSQFLTTYRFELLDRPAGTATLATGTWSISNDLTKVGWVSASGLTGAPTGAAFKYNLPGDAIIDGDTALTEIEKETAKRLAQSLPPNPTHYNVMTVNGVIQRQVNTRDLVDTEGTYVVNTFGIWWMSNLDAKQPWPSIGTIVCASSWNWNPATSSSSSSAPSCAESIQDPAYAHLRPKMALWVSRLNPALVDTIVTSLAPKTPTTPIRLTSAKTPTTDSTVGNLLIDLPIVNAGDSQDGTTAITDISGGAGNTLQVTNTKVVRQLVAGAGIALQPSTGVGAVTVSATNISNSGDVTSLEPENARLLYAGLHSYLALTNPAVRADGFIGKMTLPTSISSGQLQLSLTLFGFVGNTSGSDKNVNFQYQFVTSASGTVISDALASPTVLTITIPNGYTAKKVFKLSPVELVIPAASIQPGAIVNFRLTRAVPSSNPYTGDIGILSVGWNV